MKILLVHPEYLSEGIGFRLAAMPEPLGLEMIAAAVGEHEVRILDMRIEDPSRLESVLAEFAPDMVVYITDQTGQVRETTAGALLPDHFGPKNLSSKA